MTRNRLRATRPARGGRTPRTFRALTSRSLGCKALLTAVLVVSVGCASIHHGRRQRVVMESEPPGAAVYLGDRHLGVTPIDLELSGSDLANGLRLRKDGFEPVHVRFDRKTSRWLWGDVGLATWNGIASTQALTGAGPVYAFAGMLALTLGIDLMRPRRWRESNYSPGRSRGVRSRGRDGVPWHVCWVHRLRRQWVAPACITAARNT